MVCIPIKFGGVTGFVCYRGLKKPPYETCSEKNCNQPVDFLCDHPIKARRIRGKLQTTCDRKLCMEHATKGPTDLLGEETDFCPFHSVRVAACLGTIR